MKRYIAPQTDIVSVSIQHPMLITSGGVANGSLLGNGFTESDVTFSRGGTIWGNDEEEEE